MLLRVVRGTVEEGREADFVATCRQQVADRGRAEGLLAHFAGYRRRKGIDRFFLASTWASPEDADRTAGDDAHPLAARVFAGLARVDVIERYNLLEPVFEGILDAPGGVIRVATGWVVPGRREEMLAWMAGRRRFSSQNLMLGWAVGERRVDGREEFMAISAWPSPLVIEALVEPGREGMPLKAAIDRFAQTAAVERYQAICLDLPEGMADREARRVIAARFLGQTQADLTAGDLRSALPSARDDPIEVAPLGVPGSAPDPRRFVLVARVAPSDYARAERLIADHGGEVILTSSEPARAEHVSGGATATQ
jgi:hypothetical protein